jgi:uncharacterized protein YbjT (DUF2867 family)
MVRMIERSPVLPLVDGGNTRTTLIGMDDLCRALEAVLNRSEPREYNLCYAERPTTKQILDLLRAQLQRKTVFVPVPAWAVAVPLALLAWLRVSTPIDLENLKGYIKSKDPVHASNLSLVVPQAASVQGAIAQAWPDV